MMGKAIVAGVSLILVVGVVIGLVAGISRSGHSSNVFSNTDNASSGMKTVKTICEPTDYKDACIKTLGTVADNGTSNPKDFIKVALSATMDEVKAAMARTGSLGNGDYNITQKNALEDCNELLQYAIHELQESLSMVVDNELNIVNQRVPDLTNWLSAVISYQQTCLDGVTHPELKSAVENGLLNATQLTSNALAIVTEISQLLSHINAPINAPLNGNPQQRRLLEAEAIKTDDEGYPTWFSAADRKLLAAQGRGQLRPNAVVAKDGSGQYRTIAAALAAYPKNNRGRYVIYVKAGIYDEYITVTQDQVDVFMYGDGPRRTIVTGNKSNRGGVSTFKTASFSAIGDRFIAKAMGFRNTAGPEGHQAVALRVQSDMSAFFNCRMNGYQDTLYVQTHRQFYRNCVISGTVDFIFGDSTTIIQNSLIIVRKPMDNQQNTVTAHGRTDKRETTGLVIHNCRIVPEQLLFPLRFKIPTFLGRPWKQFARTVIMESTLGDFIQPAGWMPWDTTGFALDTCYYAEYANTGPGANTARRVHWKGFHVITDRREAAQFTAGPFLQGDLWLKGTGMPFFLGFKV